MRQGKILQQKLPGELIDANKQCTNIWKRKSEGEWKACNINSAYNCADLSCYFSGRGYETECRKSHKFPLDGTSCGANKYCLLGQCIDKLLN